MSNELVQFKDRVPGLGECAGLVDVRGEVGGGGQVGLGENVK